MSRYEKIKAYILNYLQENLSGDLYYHGIHHTLDVLRFADEIADAEGISEKEKELLFTAVLFHDTGFALSYNNHEDFGCDLAMDILPEYDYNEAEIEIICGMIIATRIPQLPQTHLERIIADADLLYLGTDLFKPIGDSLFREMQKYTNLKTEDDWNIIQRNFLQKHHYHTNYCKEKYEAPKQENLQRVLNALKHEG